MGPRSPLHHDLKGSYCSSDVERDSQVLKDGSAGRDGDHVKRKVRIGGSEWLGHGCLEWRSEAEDGTVNARRTEAKMSSLIPPNDLKVEAVSSREKGGQHVGYVNCPIKVTHLPTGISATVEMRSQHRSRQVAVEMIEAALTSPNFR